MSDENMQAELDRLRAENEALKKAPGKGLSLKVSQKGAVSLYGMGRFPVTLYKEQWTKLLDYSEEIRSFIVENDGQLKSKGTNPRVALGATSLAPCHREPSSFASGERGFPFAPYFCMVPEVEARSNSQHALERRAPRARAELSPTYYLDQFTKILGVVERLYSKIWDAALENFVRDFQSLSQDAQLLYLRMANRKKKFFSEADFRYPEILRPQEAASELKRRRDFLSAPAENDLDEILKSLSRAELLEELQSSKGHSLKRSQNLSKEKLIQAFSEVSLFAHEQNLGLRLDRFFKPSRIEELRFVYFLYFDSAEEDMKRMTLRSLRPSRRKPRAEAAQGRFEEMASARSEFFYLWLLKDLEEGKSNHLLDAASWPEALNERSRLDRARALVFVGRDLERGGEPKRAQEIYSLSELWPASERYVRLIFKRGDRDGAKARLEKIMAESSDPAELSFARDFYARKFQKQRRAKTTDELKNAELLEIGDEFTGCVEKGVAAHYRDLGLECYRTENRLFRMLFELSFWKFIHTQEQSSYARLAPSLRAGNLGSATKADLSEHLETFASPKEFLRGLVEVALANWGDSRASFKWKSIGIEILSKFLLSTDLAAVKTTVLSMAENFEQRSSGFPDLMIIEGGQARFLEVKAPGDQLGRNQMSNLELLRSAGLRAELLRVEWKASASTVYSVVDIETTGGRASTSRITEVGVVRYQDGKVLAKFSTLVNPGVNIPRNIQRITGINNDMVASAPSFAEIADELREFLGTSVFCAHNVSFDYSFIQAEYARLGERFKMKKYCTCAGARRRFKGLRSYSLKNLCQHFEIELTNHHRALCDAEAATELLKLQLLKA